MCVYACARVCVRACVLCVRIRSIKLSEALEGALGRPAPKDLRRPRQLVKIDKKESEQPADAAAKAAGDDAKVGVLAKDGDAVAAAVVGVVCVFVCLRARARACMCMCVRACVRLCVLWQRRHSVVALWFARR